MKIETVVDEDPQASLSDEASGIFVILPCVTATSDALCGVPRTCVVGGSGVEEPLESAGIGALEVDLRRPEVASASHRDTRGVKSAYVLGLKASASMMPRISPVAVTMGRQHSALTCATETNNVKASKI